MGRHAGFLTAASSLLRKLNSDGPHLIFLPEYSFKIKDFLEQVKKEFMINMEDVLLQYQKGYKTIKGI